MLPSCTVWFEKSIHEIFGNGKPKGKQRSVTFLSSKTTSVPFSIVTEAGTMKNTKQNKTKDKTRNTEQCLNMDSKCTTSPQFMSENTVLQQCQKLTLFIY